MDGQLDARHEAEKEKNERKRALWRARQHAMQVLAKRYPNEFRDLKNQMLRRWGQEPIQAPALRESTVMDPKDTGENEPPVSP